MKIWTFEVKETWFGGVKEYDLEVKARTEASATKKAWSICGNRSWELTLKVTAPNQGERAIIAGRRPPYGFTAQEAEQIDQMISDEADGKTNPYKES